MSADLSSTMALLISFQCLLFAVFIFSGWKKRELSALLIGWITLVMGLHFLSILLLEPRHIVLGPVFSPLYGPLIYFSMLAMIYRDFTLKLRHCWHLVPAVAGTLLCVLVILPGNRTLSYDQATAPILIQLLVYLAMAFRLIVHYRRIAVHTHANVLSLRFAWMKRILVNFTLVIAFAVLEHWGGHLASYFGLGIFLGMLFFVSHLFLKALNQPELFLAIDREAETLAEEPTSNHAGDQGDSLSMEIQTFMVEKKPYRDPALTLKSLATAMGMAARALSVAINQELGLNFYQFVNAYRIEEAKELLANQKRLNVTEILLQVGFQSKSSFNTAFKAAAGMTPTQFRKQGGRHPAV